MTRYFPVALDIQGRRCVVVGGGAVAARKVSSLAAAGAQVTIVAPEVSLGIEAEALVHHVEVQRRPFEPSDLEDAFLVITATDDPAVNAAVATEARQRRILVNAADDPENCDFILPAVVHRGDVQIAITSSGRSPALTRHLRERLQALLPQSYAGLAAIMAGVRVQLRREEVRVAPETWQRAIDDDLLALVADNQTDAARDLLWARLTQPVDGAAADARVVRGEPNESTPGYS